MKNPYSLTTLIFVIIAIVGAWFLDWRDVNFAFILLLYFIVTLGIKLDEIAGQIGIPGQGGSYSIEKDENILRQMAEINASLDTLNKTLNKLTEKKEQNDAGHDPTDLLAHTNEKKDHGPESSEK